MELRNGVATNAANQLPPPPPPSMEESAYTSILGAVTAFSPVHTHCMGSMPLGCKALKRAVEDEGGGKDESANDRVYFSFTFEHKTGGW